MEVYGQLLSDKIDSGLYDPCIKATYILKQADTWAKVDARYMKGHFDQSPNDKLDNIQQKEASERCIMFGDGLNDAGALKASTVGISVSNNLSAFTPASDAIILGRKLHLFPQFLQLIQQSRQVVVLGFIISFLYNAVGLSFAVAGLLTPVFAAILMPISSISVVAFSTLSIRYLNSRIQSWRSY